MPDVAKFHVNSSIKAFLPSKIWLLHLMPELNKTQNQFFMIKHLLKVGRLLPVLLLSFSLTAWAQGQKVSGKVTSADDGSSLPGVNVLEKGTTNGAVTDADGNFTISVGTNATLVFSSIGFTTQEVAVGSGSVINVSLTTDVTTLSEIIVIGYGQTTVKDATGAVASVRSESFNGGVISSPEQLIQGKTAGVQITTSSGMPGAGVQLRIRGTNSIRSNNNPLFVVDGVPLAGGTQPGSPGLGLGSMQDTNPMNFINPNDIESVSILKDASATAIYGSRGANGVVLITTKSGKGSKGAFDFTSTVSISSARKTYELLDAKEFLKGVQQYGGDPVAQDHGGKTNWQDYILRTSVSTVQNLGYQKSFKTGSIRTSFGYEKQNGIVENSSMTRMTGRINGNKTFFDNKLRLDLNSTFSNVKREDPPISSSAGYQGDLLGAAYAANPTWKADPDYDAGTLRNPANMLKYYQSKGETNRFLNSLSASYKLTSSLTAKATYGLDWSKGERMTLGSGKLLGAASGITGYGQGQLNQNKNLNNLLELTMSLNKKVGIVNIDAVGGYSFQSFHNEWFWTTGMGFSDINSFSKMDSELRNSYSAGLAGASAAFGGGIINNFGIANTLTNAGSNPTSGGFVTGISDGNTALANFNRPAGVTVEALTANYYDQTDFIQSYFGRGNFTIADKYLITATVRVDGSSKFGPENKYGVFPSGAVAWKIHDEAFMPDVFSTFKLRAGYGIVGNQDGLGYGQFRRRDRYTDVGVSASRQVGYPGAQATGNPNPGLKWEQTSTAGAGIDFGLWSEKLSGTFDVYLKHTSDLLLQTQPAQPSPTTGLIFNNLDGAIVENKGWELSLSYNFIEKQDATFTVSGNVSRNYNMLKDFGGALNAGTIYGQGLSGAFAQQLAGGHPLFSYYLRQFQGFDINGQPMGDNQTFIGKGALPKWNAGISLNATYKSFDFSAYFTGQFGQYIYNNTRNAFFTAGSIYNARNVTKDVLTSGESGTAEAAVSTRFLEKGDFFRMQNFTFGYNVPVSNSKAIKKLRFYFNGQNLFVITKYTGPDPEVSSAAASYDLLNGLPTAGIDYGSYPRPRTFTLGLNASF